MKNAYFVLLKSISNSIEREREIVNKNIKNVGNNNFKERCNKIIKCFVCAY
jgi:hypothetical protein